MAEGKFGTSLCCMDGRIQTALTSWIKKKFSVNYVDTITEPGIDKVIFEKKLLGNLKSKVEISVNAHKSKVAIISGHHDCAGNPVSREQHIAQISKDVEIVKSWNLGIKVLGVWVNENWVIEEI